MDPQQKPSDKKKIHEPEFIILDAEDEDRESFVKKSQAEYFETFQMLKTLRHTWSLRLISAVLFWFSLFVLVVFFFVFAVNVLFSVVTLFQNKKLDSGTLAAWAQFKKACVFSVGLLLAVFSPSLGFGLIVLYYLLREEKLSNKPWFMLLKSRLSQMNH
jgi:hypothetical protein